MTSHGHRSRGRCRVLPLILLCVASAQWAAQWTFVPPARLVKGSPEAASPSAQAAHAAPAAAVAMTMFLGDEVSLKVGVIYPMLLYFLLW